MGSKSKLKFGKKKKKTKTSEGSHIAAGIMPKAALAAQPCSPPPMVSAENPPPPLELNRSTKGVLSSSMLSLGVARIFSTPGLPDREEEETDTSLYDYENARHTMHSTYGTGSHEYSSGAIPAPPAGFGDDEFYDSETDITRTPSPEPGYSKRRSMEVEAEINPVYTTSLKSSQRSRSASPSSLHRSGTLTETGSLPFHSGTLRSSQGHSPMVSGILSGSGGSGRAPRAHKGKPRRTPSVSSVEERIEAQMVQSSQKSSLRSSLDKTLTRVSTDLSHTGSFRLNTLRDQNAAMAEKQKDLERQLTSQRQIQEQLMAKLREQGLLSTNQSTVPGSTQETLASLLEETQSVTDQTLEKHGEVVAALKERVLGYESEKKELEEINEQLRMEIMSVHRLASARDEDEAHVKSNMVRKLREERDTLQATVIKLNAELSRYQAKFRTLSPSELEQLPGLPFGSSKPSWLINTKYLAPLLVAYDDQIKERDAALQQTQAELEEVYTEVEAVIRENQRLHLRLDSTDTTSPVGMTEWRSLQEQCKLVLEENQLLMEQLDVQQNKTKDIHKAHVQEVSKLSKRLVIAEAERNQLEQEVTDIRDKMAEIKKEHTKAVVESRSKLEPEEHVSGMSRLKQVLEEEKTKHAHELENTMIKLQNLASERKGLSLQVEELKSDNQTMESEMKAMQKAFKKSQKKIQILQQALQDSEVKEQTAEKYLSSIIRVAEKTAQERDTFVEKAEAELKQKKAAMTKALEEKMTKSKMEEKLKLMKLKASEKLEKAAHRMKEQDVDFNQQRQEYEREIKHLRLLLRERQEMLDVAAGDRKRVEDDLEVMWQVAVADNQRMRDTVRKSLKRLDAQGHVPSDGDDQEEDDLVTAIRNVALDPPIQT